jgi:tetratricopeptide (TPR) repeat protein
MLSLSLAINYRISQLDVWSYHAFNLTIHVLAGLALFGVVRRTLLSGRLKGRFGQASWVLALICALIWLVHPLNTQAVTYVIQRAESLMGLFYLLTVYCAIRSLDSSRKGLWQAAAVVCCAAGMGTKEVMVTAPLMVVLYDRVFAFRSFKQAIGRRWRLYAGLASTWLILGALVASDPRSDSAGFGLATMTAMEYAATQCNVILHYLRLSFWPDRLVLDYDWPVARRFGDFAASGGVLVVLLACVCVALRYRPMLGFLGAWFFLILGPTSSFVPIADVAFEHRMYLPLAAVVAGAVALAYVFGARALGRLAVPGKCRQAASLCACGLAGAAIVVLAMLTAERNYDYRDGISIWTDTVAKRPVSSRAHCELGIAYRKVGDYRRAIASYDQAIRLNPNYALAYNNRGAAYAHMGEYGCATSDFDMAIRLNRSFALAYANRGNAYLCRGLYDRAIGDFDRALELNPQDTGAREGRAVAVSRRQAEMKGPARAPSGQ